MQSINLLDRIYAVNPVTGRINMATVVEPPYSDNGRTLLDVMIGDDMNTIYVTIDIEDVRTMQEFVVQVALEVGGMIRTGERFITDLKTGNVYRLREINAHEEYRIYCNTQQISDEKSSKAVWDYLLSLVHTDLTKQAEGETE